MSKKDPDRSPIERLDDRAAIDRALSRAVREALEFHVRMGNPVAIWRNERVEWLGPEELAAEIAAADWEVEDD